MAKLFEEIGCNLSINSHLVEEIALFVRIGEEVLVEA
jgi:hypothetical protein